MDGSEEAYIRNVEAPVILLNLENCKRYEKDLLFNGFFSDLNFGE